MHPLNYSGTTFLFQKDIVMLSCCLISVSFSPVKNCREFLKKKTFPVQRILWYVRSFFSAMPSLFTILTIHLMRLRFTSIILLTAGKHSLLLFLMLIWILQAAPFLQCSSLLTRRRSDWQAAHTRRAECQRTRHDKAKHGLIQLW